MRLDHRLQFWVVKASIVIPSYNYGRYLAEAIESALQQTRQPSEVLVVDDGSADDSPAVAERYPVTLLRQEHRGAVHTMASGIAASTGDCFAILNADDRMAPNYLEVSAPLLERNDRVGFVYTSLTLFGTVHDLVPARTFSLARLLASNFVHGSSLIRRRAYDSTPGLAGLDLAVYEDWYLILDLISHGWDGVGTNDTTLYYRQHGMSRNKTGGAEHERAIRRIMFDHAPLYAPTPRLWYWLHRHLFRRYPRAYLALALLTCRALQRRAC
jgi:glycosyltransferase involved in cell wall biosynthesis